MKEKIDRSIPSILSLHSPLSSRHHSCLFSDLALPPHARPHTIPVFACFSLFLWPRVPHATALHWSAVCSSLLLRLRVFFLALRCGRINYLFCQRSPLLFRSLPPQCGFVLFNVFAMS